MNTKIYVATHERNDCVLKLKPPYIPIHCGKAIYENIYNKTEYLPNLGDNTGDNISDKNRYYSELTGMYWIWKNDNSAPNDIVGLNHYRRYFGSYGSNTNLMTEDEMKSILFNEGYDFIVNGNGTNDIFYTFEDGKGVYAGFGEIHNIQDLDNAIIEIKRLYPLIANRIEFEIIHGDSMCFCNMMITTKKYFDEYCSFLFPVLQYVESKLSKDDSLGYKYSGQRSPGYVAERLFRPWLIATGHTAKQAVEVFWNV